MELGHGTDLRNQDIRKPAVAVMASNPSPDPSTGGAEINVRFVQHQFDLAKSFSLNSSLSAKNKMVGARVGFDMVDNFKASGNTVTFVFECNRNFGDRVYNVTGLDPDFVATVNEFKKSLSGAALHKAITERYGTHFISGQQKAAKVVLIYTLTYESQATSRSRALDFGLKYSNGITSADMRLALKDEMSRSDNKVSLSYQFYSSDPYAKPSFPVTAKVDTFDEFLAHAAKVEAYCHSLDPAKAKDVAYVVESIDNLPGYIQLLDGYHPERFFNSSYDRFVQIYAQLKSWDEQLFAWTADARRISWLNTNGQKLVLGMREDAAAIVKRLEDAAKSHFKDGKPLEIPADIIDYRVNFKKIASPQIRQARMVSIDPGNGGSWTFWVGVVDAGALELTIDRPFRSVVILRDGVEFGNTWDLYYDLAAFEASAPHYPTKFAWSEEVFAQFLKSTVWADLRRDAATRRLGFVAGALSHPPGYDYNKLSVGIKDASGHITEVVPFLASGAGVTCQLLEGDTHSDVSRVASQAPSTAIPGSETR